jgi:hypothetical protein
MNRRKAPKNDRMARFLDRIKYGVASKEDFVKERVHVPSVIRDQVIRQNLRRRMRAHVEQMERYWKDRETVYDDTRVCKCIATTNHVWFLIDRLHF